MSDFLDFFQQNLFIFYLAAFCILLGIEVISKVPAVLHTPLMSGANAIHGVVLVGAIIVLFNAEADDWVSLGVGFVAVVFGTLNVVGGFAVTDRMLEMFKKKK